MVAVNFNPVLTEKQTEAMDLLEDTSVDELLYGGAKYGGKSWFLCVWMFLFAGMFAKIHHIPKSAKPLPIGFMGRKVAKNFNDTTLETWFKTIPPSGYVAKGNPVEIIIDNRVKLHTGGLDNRETINKFNSAEYAVYAIDQAEETTLDDIALLRAATFGRLVVNGKPIAGKGLFTANPAACWLKSEFIDNPTKQRRFVPALPTDNPYCTKKYIDNLKDAFRHRPELLEAYLHGNWNVLEGADLVIKASWLREAEERICRMPVTKRFLVCDPARFGDDECVIMDMENAEILQTVVLPYCKTTEISSRLGQMSNSAGRIPIVVESVGFDGGSGVIDELDGMGFDVIQYNPAAKSSEPEKFANNRAEAWSMTGKVFCDGIMDKETNCPVVLKNSYDTLRNQLCTPKYKFRNTKILIESKADIKERLGRSPDHADCYVAGIWAWPKIDEVSNSDWNKRHGRERQKSAMAM